MGQAQGAASGFAGSVTQTFAKMNLGNMALSKIGSNLGVNMLGGALPLMESFFYKLKSSIENIRTEVKAAEGLGIDPGFFQGLIHGLHLDPEEVTRPLIKFERALAEAQSGSQESMLLFRRLGITFDELSTLNVESGLRRVSTGLQGLTGQARTFAGSELFGGRNPQFIAKLARGNDALSASIQRAINLGHVLTEEQQKAAVRTSEIWRDTARTIDAIWTRLGTAIAPIINAAITPNQGESNIFVNPQSPGAQYVAQRNRQSRPARNADERAYLLEHGTLPPGPEEIIPGMLAGARNTGLQQLPALEMEDKVDKLNESLRDQIRFLNSGSQAATINALAFVCHTSGKSSGHTSLSNLSGS